MTNEELYNYLLTHKNITLLVRWYDNYGSINFNEYSKDKKFQEVHITEVDADAAYDIAYNNMSLAYVLDEDMEEIIKEAFKVQKEFFRKHGWNVEKYYPAIQNMYMMIDELKMGETFFARESWYIKE